MDNLKLAQDGVYSLEEARNIIGECFLGDAPVYETKHHSGKNYGYAYDPTPWKESVVVGHKKAWITQGGCFVYAK